MIIKHYKKRFFYFFRYEKPIDTVAQLADANMEWGATHDAWIFSIRDATQPNILKLLNNFRTLSKTELELRSKTRDFSFSIERLAFGHYAIGEYITEESVQYLQLMPNDIYYEYCFAMSYKNWPMQLKLDNLILVIAQSGIQKYWELTIVMKHSNNKVQLMVATSHMKNAERNAPVIIGLSNFFGVFIVWVLGLTTSFIILIIEIFWKSYYKNNTKN